MRPAYRVIAQLIALGVVLQAAFVALGWFMTLSDIDGGQVVDKAFLDDEGWNIGLTLHGVVGMMVMPLLALVLLIVSFFAKIPGGAKWAGIVFGLVVLQVALGIFGHESAYIGLLHGLNALILFTAALGAGRRVATTTADVARPTEDAAVR